VLVKSYASSFFLKLLDLKFYKEEIVIIFMKEVKLLVTMKLMNPLINLPKAFELVLMDFDL